MTGSKAPARMGMPVPGMTWAHARGAAAHGAGHHPLQRAWQPGRDRPPDHVLAAQPAERRPVRAARQRRQPGQEVSWRGGTRPGRAARAHVNVWCRPVARRVRPCIGACSRMSQRLAEKKLGKKHAWGAPKGARTQGLPSFLPCFVLVKGDGAGTVHGAVSAWTAPGGRCLLMPACLPCWRACRCSESHGDMLMHGRRVCRALCLHGCAMHERGAARARVWVSACRFLYQACVVESVMA